MRRDRFLWIVLAVGACLRLWRLSGDLPYVFHFDEPTLVNNAVWLIQHHSLNPHFFNYPTGLIYLLAALYGILALGGTALGRFDGLHAAVMWLASHTYPQPPEGGVIYFYPTIGVPALYLIGRLLSAAAGLAAIALVYEIARRITRGEGKGLARIAALGMAISPLAVEHSRLMTTDMISSALAAGCILASLRAADFGTSRRWIVAGALGGLAAGVKYNAGLVVLVLPILAVSMWRGRGHGESRLAPFRLLACAAIGAVLAFLITTPFALLDWKTFARDLGYEMHRVGSVTESFKGAKAVQATPAEKIGWVFLYNLGVIGLFAAAWGAVVIARLRRLSSIAILAWTAFLLLPLLRWNSLYPRYLLPVWPAVMVLAAAGIVDAAARLKRATREKLPSFAPIAVLCAAVLLPGAYHLAQLERTWTGHDPRGAMTAWCDQNIPEGEQIVCEPVGAFPDPNRYTIQTVDFLGLSSPHEYEARGVRYLAGSGRERLIAGKESYRRVLSNLAAIRDSSDRVWAQGHYAIYRLRFAPGWQDTVRDAIKNGNAARARAILEKKVLEKDGSTPFAWKTLAQLREDTADTAAAMVAWREAARLDTTDVEVFLSQASITTAAGEWDAALRFLDHALRISPRDPLIHHNIAVALLSRAREKVRRGDQNGARADWDAAVTHAKLCAKFAPDDPMTEILGQVERMGARWGFTQ